MFGQPRFAAMNAHINSVFERQRVLISAHRGSGGGSVAVNTTLGIKAAVLHGADIVEIDVTASRDGEFYCFHDGCEPELLGIEANLQNFSAAEIDKLSYIWVDRPGRPAKVERLLPMLRSFRETDTLFNIDRSWWRWPNMLKALDGLYMAHQILMKCPAWEEAALDRLREFNVKFPFVPICATPEDVLRTVNDPDLNTVGVELITNFREHPWFSPAVIESCHEQGVFVFVNTVTLPTGVPLFGGLDDELAISESPDAAYGPVFDLGVDAVQTDWPALVRDYRARRLAAWPGQLVRSETAAPA
ncbi:MAG: glycerophosphodiester phosphodiesterase family protein [Propionibacteriaceae bacterium]|nr:glycerophosphodiester phosphodiesterase family protein [Propionibacteriaceae bacterium]